MSPSNRSAVPLGAVSTSYTASYTEPAKERAEISCARDGISWGRDSISSPHEIIFSACPLAGSVVLITTVVLLVHSDTHTHGTVLKFAYWFRFKFFLCVCLGSSLCVFTIFYVSLRSHTAAVAAEVSSGFESESTNISIWQQSYRLVVQHCESVNLWSLAWTLDFGKFHVLGRAKRGNLYVNIEYIL